MQQTLLKKLTRYIWALFGTMLLTASPVMAQPDRSQNPGPYYGVAITPAVYFVNFLLLYWANLHDAETCLRIGHPFLRSRLLPSAQSRWLPLR